MKWCKQILGTPAGTQQHLPAWTCHYQAFERFPRARTQVVGFDMVDDESKPERRPAKHMQGPRAWDLKHNPAYAYYAYYTYANLFTLNKLREARGLNTFALRPHAGALLLCQR